ncbi:MAG: hypothetical protein V4684_04650 [Pseudomonadota bacterium]
MYLSTRGNELQFANGLDELRAEYVLQRHRNVWVVTDSHPHLAIDEEALRSWMRGLDRFVLLSEGILWQNIGAGDLKYRLLAALVGPGTSAAPSPDGKIYVEGEANPQANFLVRPNGMLHIGTHPFAAMGVSYLAIEPGRIFQRAIGKHVGITGTHRGEPRSEVFDFRKLADLTNALHEIRLGSSSTGDLSQCRDLLDQIFIENEASLAAFAAHHECAPRKGPEFTYPPTKLTRYGRLVHDADGRPHVETSFALLHYEKALHEFDALKRAIAADELERSFMHGVYCVVAIASCLEAVANRLIFDADGKHPDGEGSALAKINGAARRITIKKGANFNTLGGKHPLFVSMDCARELRNSFVHARETAQQIDPLALTSIQLSALSEDACRSLLRDLRLTVAYVFEQLPWLAPPISTAINVTWIKDIERP